jgi:hypothetical protein
MRSPEKPSRRAGEPRRIRELAVADTASKIKVQHGGQSYITSLRIPSLSMMVLKFMSRPIFWPLSLRLGQHLRVVDRQEPLD